MRIEKTILQLGPASAPIRCICAVVVKGKPASATHLRAGGQFIAAFWETKRRITPKLYMDLTDYLLITLHAATKTGGCYTMWNTRSRFLPLALPVEGASSAARRPKRAHARTPSVNANTAA